MRNIAYIDGQNLYMATTKAANPWRIDFKRFRVYLRNKYKVDEAYYFKGAYDEIHMNLYIALQQAGFILIFRKHGANLKSAKKGNVDVDLMFFALTDLIECSNSYEQIFIVSGDGDYFRLIEYLISKQRLCKFYYVARSAPYATVHCTVAPSRVQVHASAYVKEKAPLLGL